MRSANQARAANQMARAFMGSMITFLVTASYLAIAATSTTDDQLIAGRQIQLPLLGVDVPIELFFPLACWMTVILHVVFLLQVHFLFRKLRAVHEGSEARRMLVPAVLVEAFYPSFKKPGIWFLLRLILVLPLFPIAWGLLVLASATFSAARPEPLPLAACLLAAGLDCVVCWWLVPGILRPPPAPPARRHRHPVRGWWLTFEAATLLFLFLLLVPYFTLQPSDCRSPKGWIQRTAAVLGPCIEAADAAFVDPEAGRRWLATPPEERTATLRLAGRDLSEGNFRRARLVGADLRGVDLRRADLRDARLAGADLRRLPDSDRHDGDNRSRLAGADLRGADLRGAWLDGADLRQSDLRAADLRGATLSGADLYAARLDGARLDAARFDLAELRGAVLDRASMVCADLSSAEAGGLRARSAKAPGASLRYSQLIGSHWADARLAGADFRGARLVGSDLQGADLSWSRGLPLRKIGLRQARLHGVQAAPELAETAAVLSDVRGVTWNEAEPTAPPAGTALLGDLEELRRAVRGFPPAGRRLDACEGRLEGWAGGGETADGLRPIGDAFARAPSLTWARDNLGVDGSPPESEFHRKLVRELIPPSSAATRDLDPRLCSSLDLARSLILRAAGCLVPRDPIFERRLASRLREVSAEPDRCESLRRLGTALPATLRPAAEPRLDAWPPGRDFPRWKRELRSCDELQQALWTVSPG